MRIENLGDFQNKKCNKLGGTITSKIIAYLMRI